MNINIKVYLFLYKYLLFPYYFDHISCINCQRCGAAAIKIPPRIILAPCLIAFSSPILFFITAQIIPKTNEAPEAKAAWAGFAFDISLIPNSSLTCAAKTSCSVNSLATIKAVSFFNQLEIRMFASVRNINGLLTDIRDIKRNKYNLNQYIQNYAYHDLNSPVLMELIKEGKI